MSYYAFKGLLIVPASINIEASSYEEALKQVFACAELEVSKYHYDEEGVWVVNPDEEDFSWEIHDFVLKKSDLDAG